MNLQKAHTIAADLIRYHLGAYNGIKLSFSSSKRRAGAWIRKWNRVPEMRFSRPITELNSEEFFIDTVLHEIAHALAGPKEHHSGIWKEIALSIGCNGERYYKADIQTPTPKYKGTCPTCKMVLVRHRRQRIACGRCCQGIFNSQHLIIWEK